MKRQLPTILIFLFLSHSGFANTSSEALYNMIADKTAFSLGLEQDDISLSDFKQQGVEIRYKVKAKSGKAYRCYVTSAGTIMSQAVCGEKGKPFQNPLLR